MDLGPLKSGRYLLTIACAGVFIYTSCTGLLPIDATKEILVIVFSLYFCRNRPIVSDESLNKPKP